MMRVLLLGTLLIPAIWANSMSADLYVKLVVPRSDELSPEDVEAIGRAQGYAYRYTSSGGTSVRKRFKDTCADICENILWPHCSIWAPVCGEYGYQQGAPSEEETELSVVEVDSPECTIEAAVVLHKLDTVVSSEGQEIIREAISSCYTNAPSTPAPTLAPTTVPTQSPTPTATPTTPGPVLNEGSALKEVPSSCVVKGINLWNTDDGVVGRRNVGNLIPVCIHDYNYSFEAVVESEANCSVDFDLLGQDGYHYERTENEAPYFAFGDMSDGTIIQPASLELGVYDLRAFPHGQRDQAVFVKFLVMGC